MGLKNFLYRCPSCGHDPMDGTGREARCSACGTTFVPAEGRARFRVTRRDGTSLEFSGAELARAIEAFGGPLTRARSTDGRILYRSAVSARFAADEVPLRRGSRLMGFYERPGRPVRGVLVLESTRLRLDAERGEEARDWDLLELRALQASSSAVQVSPPEAGVVIFRFEDESAYRWDELLKWSLRAAWRDAGRGEIIEFQPRIRVR